MKKFKLKFASNMSTIMGYLVAIATGYAVIDWTNFDIKKEWPKLICLAIIAIGGHATSINALKNKID